VAGSGAFISRSVTGEGLVHHELARPCRDRLAGRPSLTDSANRCGLVEHGESTGQIEKAQ